MTQARKQVILTRPERYRVALLRGDGLTVDEICRTLAGHRVCKSMSAKEFDPHRLRVSVQREVKAYDENVRKAGDKKIVDDAIAAAAGEFELTVMEELAQIAVAERRE